MLKTKQIHL